MSTMKTGQDYSVEYQNRFKNYSAKEILDAFNSQVNDSGRVSGAATAPISYRAALRQEFIRRGIDYSAIGNSTGLSFRDEIGIEDRTIIKNKPIELNEFPGLSKA